MRRLLSLGATIVVVIALAEAAGAPLGGRKGGSDGLSVQKTRFVLNNIQSHVKGVGT